MRILEMKFVKTSGIILVALLVTCGAVGLQQLAAERETSSEAAVAEKPGLGVELVKGRPHTLLVPENVRTALGIRKDNVDQIVTAVRPTRTRPLPMPGTTMLDPTRLIPIRALFAPRRRRRKSSKSARSKRIG